MAITEGGEGARAGSSSAAREGSASEEIGAASAWTSFCEVEGREAGATGAEGASRFAQQAEVAQCVLSQPVQQQLLRATRARALVRVDAAKTPCHARTNPSRRTTAILIGRNVMFGDWSLSTSNPYGDCHSSLCEETLLLPTWFSVQSTSPGALELRRKTRNRLSS